VLWPAALDRWILPKVVVLGVAALVASFAVARGRLPRWMLWLAAAATAVLLLSALLSQNPAASLLGIWPRYEGLVTGAAYALSVWAGARLLGPDSSAAQRRFFLLGLAAASAVLAAVTFLEAAGLRPFASNLSRPGALLGNATDQGAVAAAFAVVLATQALAKPIETEPRWTRFLLAGGSLLAVATVLLSGSRAALLATLVGLVAAALLTQTTTRARVVTAIASVAAICVAALLTPTIGPRLLGVSPLAGGTLADRLLIWREALELVGQHPLLWVGPSGFAAAVATVHDVGWYTSVGQETVLDSPHDVILQALVVGGPLLCLALVVALILVSGAIVRRVRGEPDSGRRRFVAAAALGAAAVTIVELTHVTAPGPVMLAGLLVGAAVAVPAAASATTSGSAPTVWSKSSFIVAPLAISAWLVLVIVTLVGETNVGAAVAAAKSGQTAVAEQEFTAAHAARPWDSETVVIAAESLTEQLDGGDPDAVDAATRWTHAALDAAPTSRSAGKSAVTVALARGDLDEAEKLVTRFRALMPKDPWFAHRAGAIALLRGDDVAAEKLLKLAVRLDPSSADPWLTLAYLYQQRGDAAAAAHATAQATALTTGN